MARPLQSSSLVPPRKSARSSSSNALDVEGARGCVLDAAEIDAARGSVPVDAVDMDGARGIELAEAMESKVASGWKLLNPDPKPDGCVPPVDDG